MKKGKQESEKGIFLLMENEGIQEFVEKFIFPVVQAMDPDLKFAVVLIENDDDLRKLLRNFEPRLFIFDKQKKYYLGQHCYKAEELLQRMMQQYGQATGMIFSSELIPGARNSFSEGKVDENYPNIIWFSTLSVNDCKVPGAMAVEKVIKMAFS